MRRHALLRAALATLVAAARAHITFTPNAGTRALPAPTLAQR
jgi:hypothetical protein